MSYMHGKNRVTLENYRKLYKGKGYSEDIFDEIRLAILDETPIGSLIELCKNDSYRLNQLRIAIREGVEPWMINVCFSGRVISWLRAAFHEGTDLSPLKRYISYSPERKTTSCNLSEETFVTLIKAMMSGVDISKVDFEKVPAENVKLFCEGLRNNYPVWLFVGHALSLQKLKLLMTLMSKGCDVSCFLSDSWSEQQIFSLVSRVGSIDINEVLRFITDKFSPEQIAQVAHSYQFNLDTELVSRCDASGYPIYNEYQMQVLIEAMQNGVLTDEMTNPELSDYQMQTMLTNAISSSLFKSLNNQGNDSVIGGTLPK